MLINIDNMFARDMYQVYEPNDDWLIGFLYNNKINERMQCILQHLRAN